MSIFDHSFNDERKFAYKETIQCPEKKVFLSIILLLKKISKEINDNYNVDEFLNLPEINGDFSFYCKYNGVKFRGTVRQEAFGTDNIISIECLFVGDRKDDKND